VINLVVYYIKLHWIVLGAVQILKFAMGLVELGHSVDGLGWQWSWKMDLWDNSALLIYLTLGELLQILSERGGVYVQK